MIKLGEAWTYEKGNVSNIKFTICLIFKNITFPLSTNQSIEFPVIELESEKMGQRRNDHVHTTIKMEASENNFNDKNVIDLFLVANCFPVLPQNEVQCKH